MSPAKLGPEWESFAQAEPNIPKPQSTQEYREYKEWRGKETQAHLASPTFAMLAERVAVDNRHIELPEAPGHKFPLRVYRPSRAKPQDKFPVMLYFHGGYWVGGDANSEDLGCRAIIARGNDIVVASFSYRTMPGVAWDQVLRDAELAMRWIARPDNAASVGAATSKGFLIGGAEAGAHLAWSPDPTGMGMFTNALDVPESEKRKGENFPMWESDMKGLPPADIPMDGCDPTRDQAFLYTELLQQAGVLTRTDYYQGLPNMFVQFPELPSTLKAGGHLAAGVAWLLQERK
ncbi:hypothetical protein INS49_011038 [Diaporthe citri]|uniref:uncharacterized protein n=1 Tax=Diaporthe citri TaxID=83186 RepID=UPI001C8015E9|nr:uncharacterized protein INS49_011038 [Diaporthe citri]KAG6359983.1 hypothetical protein INS49_011038 [Diaporthe citri]